MPDCRFEPDMLDAMLSIAAERQTALLSAVGRLTYQHWFERMLQPVASMVTIAPQISSVSSNFGIAVISLLFSSTTTCPRLIRFAVAHALTMWIADFPVALS